MVGLINFSFCGLIWGKTIKKGPDKSQIPLLLINKLLNYLVLILKAFALKVTVFFLPKNWY
jgi:hypothetical protein